MDFPSRLDLLALARTYIRTRAKKIDPNQIDVIGSDINLFVGSNMVVATELVYQLAAAVAKLLIDGAEDDDLDRLAWDRYQMVRKGAAPALGVVQFSRSTADAGAGAVPVNTRLQNNTGVEFVTVTQATFGALTLSASANVRSVQAGQLNQSDAGTIVSIPDPGLLWDKTLRVTNPIRTSFAADREEDEPFRARIKSYWNTARRGTLRAIEQGAIDTPGVASASAAEELTGGSQPARVVKLYVADADGSAGAGLVIDLGEYRAAGIQVVQVMSITQLVDVQLKLTFQAGKDTDTLTEQVRTAILGTVNKCEVNGVLFRAALLETLRSFIDDGLIPTNDSVVDPAGDLVPDLGKSIRTTIDRVTVV